MFLKYTYSHVVGLHWTQKYDQEVGLLRVGLHNSSFKLLNPCTKIIP